MSQFELSKDKINQIKIKFKNIENITNNALRTNNSLFKKEDLLQLEYLFFLQNELINILKLLRINHVKIIFTNCQKKELIEVIKKNILELLHHHLIYSYLNEKNNPFLCVLKLVFHFLREAQKNKKYLILNNDFFLEFQKELETLYQEPVNALKKDKHI